MEKEYLEEEANDMKAKRRFVMALFMTLSIVLVTMIATVADKNALSMNFLRAGAVDNWTEKAYQAPTDSSVGYDHYYLGCPGNQRTSDAANEHVVTLEDITIDPLTVIQSSAVPSSDKILNISSDSITNLDQDDPVYVNDSNHKSLFFSRSGHLDGVSPILSSFSFTIGDSEQNYLGTVEFNYRYLDHNTSLDPTHSDHIFTTYNNGASDVYRDFAFENDNTWHTATIAINAKNATTFSIKMYDLQGHFYISGLSFSSVWDDLGLQNADPIDAFERTTLSDLGISESYIPTGTSHIFGDYDFDNRKGIDLWFEIEYTVQTEDKYCYFFLFNGIDADGIILRFQLTRTEDDGMIPIYIFTYLTHQDGNTVVTGEGAAGTFFWFPAISGIKSSGAVLHMTAYCVDETINKYRCAFTGGYDVDHQYYPSTNEWDTTNTEKTFDIVLGSNYFNNNAHHYTRFSTNAENTVRVKNVNNTNIQTTYKDIEGNVVGKTTSNTISTPELESNGKTFLGWFDAKGNRIADQSSATGKLVLTPRFVNNQTNMFTLSDYGFETSSSWFDIDSEVSGEATSEEGKSVNEGEAIDLYFIYEVTSCTGLDNYTIFGFPYNTKDDTNRIIIRINEIIGSTAYQGYIYNASLGPVGAEGTSFASSDRLVNKTRTHNTLVHISYHVVGVNTIDLTLELTNLGTGSSYSVTRQATFSTNFDVTSDYSNLNKFSIIQPVGEFDARVTDAF